MASHDKKLGRLPDCAAAGSLVVVKLAGWMVQCPYAAAAAYPQLAAQECWFGYVECSSDKRANCVFQQDTCFCRLRLFFVAHLGSVCETRWEEALSWARLDILH